MVITSQFANHCTNNVLHSRKRQSLRLCFIATTITSNREQFLRTEIFPQGLLKILVQYCPFHKYVNLNISLIPDNVK